MKIGRKNERKTTTKTMRRDRSISCRYREIYIAQSVNRVRLEYIVCSLSTTTQKPWNNGEDSEKKTFFLFYFFNFFSCCWYAHTVTYRLIREWTRGKHSWYFHRDFKFLKRHLSMLIKLYKQWYTYIYSFARSYEACFFNTILVHKSSPSNARLAHRRVQKKKLFIYRIYSNAFIVQ